MKEIPLSNGGVTLVDDEDFEYLMQWRWRRSSKGYCVRNVAYRVSRGKWNNKIILMHRFIMNAPQNMFVDHKWGDRLDNRKENLRLCTRSENQMNQNLSKKNTSGFKGVYLCKRSKRWGAQIYFNSKRKSLGYFITPIEAAKAYNTAALEYHGEFAKLNPIPE